MFVGVQCSPQSSPVQSSPVQCSAAHGYRQATVRLCVDGRQGRLIKEVMNWKKREGGGGEEEEDKE